MIEFRALKELTYSSRTRALIWHLTSLKNASIDSELEDLVVVLLHDLLNRCFLIALHRHISVLQQELVQDVAIVGVHGQNFVQAGEHLLLHFPVWVDEGSQLLSEVDCLVDSDLGSILLVLFEEPRERLNHDLAAENLIGVQVELAVVSVELGQEIMEGLDSAWSENFV